MTAYTPAPRYGQPDPDEPAEYAHLRGWYRDHNGHQKFRAWDPKVGPLPYVGYPWPKSLNPSVEVMADVYLGRRDGYVLVPGGMVARPR